VAPIDEQADDAAELLRGLDVAPGALHVRPDLNALRCMTERRRSIRDRHPYLLMLAAVGLRE
jgi:hypothetical protein